MLLDCAPHRLKATGITFSFSTFLRRLLPVTPYAQQTIQGKADGRALRGALDTLPLPVVRFDGLFGAERILALAPHRRHGPVVLTIAEHILLHLSSCLQILSRLQQYLSTSGPQFSLDFVQNPAKTVAELVPKTHLK